MWVVWSDLGQDDVAADGPGLELDVVLPLLRSPDALEVGADLAGDGVDVGPDRRTGRDPDVDVAAGALGADPAAAGGPRLKILPLGPIERTYGDRLLVIGDAAGLVKPTTGGGIYYSIVSGSLAAEVAGDGLRRAASDREAAASWLGGLVV